MKNNICVIITYIAMTISLCIISYCTGISKARMEMIEQISEQVIEKYEVII